MNKMEDKQMIESFYKYLKANGNIKKFATNFDNNKEPIHRWFPFLAGFSNKLVLETIKFFNLTNKVIYEPFMGSGTTGVVGKEIGVNVIGNESNEFLYRICKLKTRIDMSPTKFDKSAKRFLEICRDGWRRTSVKDEDPILKRCYSLHQLKKLVCLKERLSEEKWISNNVKEYLFMAVTMALPKTSNVGINVPYISWRHQKKPEEVFKVFERSIKVIKEDLEFARKRYRNNSKVKVYLHDSRIPNQAISDNSVDGIFTSPPYLNNFDYGESLKVFLYFWGYSSNWNDISKKIRYKAVASATTYYKESVLKSNQPDKILGNQMLKDAPLMCEKIKKIGESIRSAKIRKGSKKNFELLTYMYFKDMFKSLKEMYRITRINSLNFMIVGDSAPFGVHVPTDIFLGEIGKEIGFSSYEIIPLRERGTKWTTLKNRHNLKLRECILILKKER